MIQSGSRRLKCRKGLSLAFQELGMARLDRRRLQGKSDFCCMEESSISLNNRSWTDNVPLNNLSQEAIVPKFIQSTAGSDKLHKPPAVHLC